MANTDYRAELCKLADQLRQPLRLRIAVCGVALALAYFGIYLPLDGQIASATRQWKEAERRLAVAQEVESLRAQMAGLQPRLFPSPDPNDAVQYLLDGIRALPVTLLRLDSDASADLGPYEAVVSRLEVQGEMRHLDALLLWLETNQRLLRVDSIRLDPPRGNEKDPVLRLTLLALKVRP